MLIFHLRTKPPVQFYCNTHIKLQNVWFCCSIKQCICVSTASMRNLQWLCYWPSHPEIFWYIRVKKERFLPKCGIFRRLLIALISNQVTFYIFSVSLYLNNIIWISLTISDILLRESLNLTVSVYLLLTVAAKIGHLKKTLTLLIFCWALAAPLIPVLYSPKCTDKNTILHLLLLPLAFHLPFHSFSLPNIHDRDVSDSEHAHWKNTAQSTH